MPLLLLAVLLLAAEPARAAPPQPPESSANRHWSLRPRTCPPVPQFSEAAQRDWAHSPVDAFILARQVQEKERPAPEANRATLIRRLTFDLTGLPPTPEEVAAFVGDAAPDAYERLVDRLLASPHYGERQGRHWLDVVRFAETEGFEYDRHRAGAWRFRDYVISAFNQDRPFDRFVREQLAGDEIEPSNRELQIAAGFHRLGPVRRNAGNQELAFSRHEVLTEMTDIIGAAFLGLTVGCARCHDHKFDSFSHADYYRLQAFFAATREHDIVLASEKEQAEWKARTEKLQREIKSLRLTLANLKGEPRREAEAKVEEWERQLPPPLPTISSVRNVESERLPIHILKRGDTDKKERQVGPRLPSALIPANVAEFAPESPNPRTILARWITSSDNPLTARVLVNRIWQQHFGRGLVATANDFGANGSPPTHPELLDWLAEELVRGGWHLKPIHRLIVLSNTYRQSAQRSPDEGRLLAGFPRRRLGAEEVRDAMLHVAGRLNGKMGGPSVIVPADADLVNLLYAPSQWTVTPDRAEHARRSVYLLAKRNLRLPFMEAFDQPDAQTPCACRESSTHALQALELLNGKLANDLAKAFAHRLRREAGIDPTRQVERAYLLAIGRQPTERERRLAVAFLKHQPLQEFALAMFNLNAFLYVD